MLIRLFLDRNPQTSVVKVLRLALVVADDGVIVMGSENGAIPARIHSPGSGSNRACAETRMRWEPIIELTQIKGDGAHLNRIRPSRAGWTRRARPTSVPLISWSLATARSAQTVPRVSRSETPSTFSPGVAQMQSGPRCSRVSESIRISIRRSKPSIMCVPEIPTPGRRIYDAAFFCVDIPHNVTAAQQDRADTSHRRSGMRPELERRG